MAKIMRNPLLTFKEFIKICYSLINILGVTPIRIYTQKKKQFIIGVGVEALVFLFHFISQKELKQLLQPLTQTYHSAKQRFYKNTCRTFPNHLQIFPKRGFFI
jgi:hypothetical protein